MINKGIKVLVIAIGLIIVIALNDAIFNTGGQLNAILIIGFLAFAGAVWRWNPKSKNENLDTHKLDKE